MILTSVITTVRPTSISAALNAFRRLPSSSRPTGCVFYLGGYPVALGRKRGGVCAGEMPLAGYRVLDAFGYDVRAFVWRLQVRPSGGTRSLQRRTAAALHILSAGRASTDTVLETQSCAVLSSIFSVSQIQRMHWSMNTLPLPPYVELGVHSLSSLLWPVLLLFLWHCYRMGSDLPIPGHTHAGKLKSSSRRSMLSRSGSCIGTKCSARSKLSRSEQITPFISMETVEDEEQGQSYLTPVLSHALFPAQASAEAKKLYTALQEYAKRYSWVGMGRIHKGLREQVRLNDLSAIQKPHLFFLPDVPSVPFFPRDAHRHDIEVLEANYPAILAEFKGVYQRGIDSKSGWTSLGPKGQAVFSLYSAGVCVAGNCRSCPCTYRTLLSLRTFISSNSLGSAGFWLLGPGATLGSSYGPTNTRLRCHLGLQTPPLCELVVGGEPQCWSEGHCLLVDDSFLHTVSHKGPPDSGPRVILSVDLWHPNVAAAERQALDFMFSPDQ